MMPYFGEIPTKAKFFFSDYVHTGFGFLIKQRLDMKELSYLGHTYANKFAFCNIL
jgi:hypothetical protein